MNINTKNLPIRIILLTVLCLLVGIGCTKKYTPPVVVFMPERIIDEFSDMREHEIMSRAWIRRGFALSNCRSIDIKPLTDSSQTPQPAVVKRIQEGLHDILNDRINKNGELDVIVWTNIIDVKVKPGRIKGLFKGFDAMPYIELEIVITDSTTGLPLVKVIHFRRDMKSLKTAVTNILGDLRKFFSTAL
jgi:hypothetical protein